MAKEQTLPSEQAPEPQQLFKKHCVKQRALLPGHLDAASLQQNLTACITASASLGTVLCTKVM